MQANAITKKAAETMLSADIESASLGVEIKDVSAGYAEMSMTIHNNMGNEHNTTHGGIFFSFADTVFTCAGKLIAVFCGQFMSLDKPIFQQN